MFLRCSSVTLKLHRSLQLELHGFPSDFSGRISPLADMYALPLSLLIFCRIRLAGFGVGGIDVLLKK